MKQSRFLLRTTEDSEAAAGAARPQPGQSCRWSDARADQEGATGMHATASKPVT